MTARLPACTWWHHANKAGAIVQHVIVPPARMPARNDETTLQNYLTRQQTLVVLTDVDDATNDDDRAAVGLLHNFPTFALRTFGGNADADIDIDVRPAPLYAGQYARFVTDAKTWSQAEDATTIILTSRLPQLQALAKEHDLTLPECWPVEPNQPLAGFRSEKIKLLVLTDREIFPRDAPSVRSRSLDTSFLAELKMGDYAVHPGPRHWHLPRHAHRCGERRGQRVLPHRVRRERPALRTGGTR